jgi:hopanoid biosynthesis associated RND transporter like protein HpnN
MATFSRTGRVLSGLVRLSCRNPAFTVALSLLAAALGIVYTVQELSFKTSTLDLLPRGQRYAILYGEHMKDFGELDDIAVVVEGRSLEESKAYATRLVRELKRSPAKFQRVAYRIDPKRFQGRALLYLSKEKLVEIRDKIFDHQEFMESFAASPGIEQLIAGINQQIAGAMVTAIFDLGLQDKGGAVDLRFLKDLLAQISERIDRPAPYRSPWGALFTFWDQREEADAGYFLSDDKSLLFILVEPASQKGSFTGDRAAIEAIRRTIVDLRPEFPHVQVGVTGAPALSNDEMTAAFKDSEVATLLAFALTLALLILAFRLVGKPLLMLAVLAVSLAWSMGVVTLTVGHLSIFSVMFISIVVGIGIDYGIYFLFRYEEERFLGRDLTEALLLTAGRSGPGILYGGLTAAAAFYVLTLTEFRGIQELGFIAGTSILLAWLAMMTFFPAVLILADRRAGRLNGAVPRAVLLERIRVPILERIAAYPKTILVAAGVLTAFSLWALSTVKFDYNLLNLQAKGTESVAWEKKILAKAGRSGFTGLATAESLGELRRKHEAFDRLPSVSEVDSAILLIPDGQREKIKIIRDFAPLVAPVKIGISPPVDLESLKSALGVLVRRFDIALDEIEEKDHGKEIAKMRAQIATLQEKLDRSSREEAEVALTHLQSQLYQDFVDKFHMLQRNLKPQPVSLKDVPPELQRKFIGRSGRFLIQIHPKTNIWERAGARRFVRELRSVDPDVTGSPVITYEAIRLMERAYLQGTIYAFAVVAALAALMFRRLRESLLALIPLGLGALWTVGLMHLLGLKFNLANVFGLPLIVGTAAEYGLNVVARSVEGRDHGGPLLARSTVMAVILNGLTTIVGFGSLMVASHQGIFGLGLLLTIGASASLAASLVVLPVLIRLFGRKPVTHRVAASLPNSPAA